MNKVLIFFCFIAISSFNLFASTVRYQHTDMLGSVVAESDESGNISPTSRSHYEPFGKRIGGDKDGIGYTGHIQDKDLGLTYMQARYYDPLIGRFYANDPLSFRDVHSFNRYAYAANNPYKFKDPSGQNEEFVAGVSAGIFFDSQLVDQLAFYESSVFNFDYAQGLRTGQDISQLELLNVFDNPAVLSSIFMLAASRTSKVTKNGDNSVYQSTNASGTVNYVGITNNLERRAGEHLGQKGISIDAIPGLSNLSRTDARAVEQVLIENHGLGKNGGTLLNQINSISQKNPVYAESLTRGAELLKSSGYPGF